MGFFAELRRRNVFKVAAAYGVVAWLLVQIVVSIETPLSLPDWSDTLVIVLLAVGFPISLVLSWAYERTPEGIKLTAAVPRGHSVARLREDRFNYFLLGLIVPTLAFIVMDQYVLPRMAVPESTEPGPGIIRSGDTGSVQLLRTEITLESADPIGDTGLGAHLAISRDGRYLVYAAERDGRSQLYLRALDGFHTRPIPGTENAYHPFFSADGMWLGFFTERTSPTSLKKVAIRGGLPQDLASTTFSAGGSWGLNEIVYGTGTEDSGRSLFRIAANGGPPEALLTAGAEEGYVRPHLLPGDKAVLFVVRPGPGGSGNARDGSIAVLSLDTRDIKPLIQRGFAPRFSPTGHVVFVRGDAIWAVPFDPERLEILGPEVPIIEGVQNDGFRGTAAYAFSDNGILAYLPGSDMLAIGVTRNLVWVDRQGNEEPTGLGARDYTQIKLSPEGERLAALVSEESNVDVWTFDLATWSSNRLTIGPTQERRPLWSPPNGEQVIYGAEDGIYAKAASGGQPEPLLTDRAGTDRAGPWPETVSPDGQWLIFGENGEQAWDLHVLSLRENRSAEPLLQIEGNQEWASFAPDGGWIAYASTEAGQHEVFVRPFPDVTRSWRQISIGGGTEPLWGSNGELFYRTEDAVMAVSYTVVSSGNGPSFEASDPTPLFPADDYVLTPSWPSYDYSSKRDRFLMMKLAETEAAVPQPARLLVVYDWFEELRQLAPQRQRPEAGGSE